MPKKRRVNHNRIPAQASSLDRDNIIQRANSGNIVYAWLLVLHTLIYHEAGAEQEEAVRLARKAADDAVICEMLSAADLRKAETITGMKTPYHDIMTMPLRTQGDVERLYKKAKKCALHNALRSIALGLERLGYYDTDTLNRVFTNVRITLAEIEDEQVSYDDLMKDIDSSAMRVGRNVSVMWCYTTMISRRDE